MWDNTEDDTASSPALVEVPIPVIPGEKLNQALGIPFPLLCARQGSDLRWDMCTSLPKPAHPFPAIPHCQAAEALAVTSKMSCPARQAVIKEEESHKCFSQGLLIAFKRQILCKRIHLCFFTYIFTVRLKSMPYQELKIIHSMVITFIPSFFFFFPSS